MFLCCPSICQDVCQIKYFKLLCLCLPYIYFDPHVRVLKAMFFANALIQTWSRHTNYYGRKNNLDNFFFLIQDGVALYIDITHILSISFSKLEFGNVVRRGARVRH